mmetsp:Transcript_35863/g.33967  ORF Transcript_35863/g.33967 Transcript_35863/m.33967 type:complete len:143 (-) Transcript_35863:67-495(-)
MHEINLSDLDKKGGRNVIVRTQSDVFLETILDSLRDDDHVNDDDDEEKDSTIIKERPLRIVNHGLGEVTTRDIMIAGAANATIVTYSMPIERDARKLAQSKGIRTVEFDKLEDLITIIKEGLSKELLQLAKANKPPAKKSKK